MYFTSVLKLSTEEKKKSFDLKIFFIILKHSCFFLYTWKEHTLLFRHIILKKMTFHFHLIIAQSGYSYVLKFSEIEILFKVSSNNGKKRTHLIMHVDSAFLGILTFSPPLSYKLSYFILLFQKKNIIERIR